MDQWHECGACTDRIVMDSGEWECPKTTPNAFHLTANQQGGDESSMCHGDDFWLTAASNNWTMWTICHDCSSKWLRVSRLDPKDLTNPILEEGYRLRWHVAGERRSRILLGERSKHVDFLFLWTVK